ncbi:alpha/beta hydrolase [Kribbella catacumbae]|uniref:alpha/beta hydrolase n=1 Tax=Kribbella catacumbae TaxID=460086 RepID=UPI00037B40D0|nr:alpha/beta hydrolase [Kribbella catacumbae]
MKRILVAGLGLLLAGGVMPVAAAAEPGKVGGIKWHGCQTGPGDEEGAELDRAGAQCGELTVPLDYRRPEGKKIQIAMSRLKATGDRIGTMVLNDGGPGGPGLGMPVRLRTAMQETGTRYDLIGMDPRFVGRSTPLDCKWPDGNGIWSAGATRASFERGARKQADLAKRCSDSQAALLPYVTTRNTVRDIDQIRAALGEEKISYLGYSYGTYLGSVYLQMFPGRLDRVVLDGPVDPDQYGPALLQTAGPANEAALRAWAGWAAARDRTYHLGRTTDQVMAKVQRIYRVSSERPLQVGRHPLDDSMVPLLLMSQLANDRDPARAGFAAMIQTLLKATTGPVQPGEQFGQFLDLLFGQEMAAGASAQIAIICGDRAADRDLNSYWRDIQRHRKSEPYFGALTRNLLACAFWPGEPVEKPTRVANAVPALLVAADGDPRTTYPQAKVLHQALTGSRLVTLRNARTHGVFGEYGNECVDRLVIDYLGSGQLPSTDRTCHA